jgi:ferrous iron transport protein B
VLKGEASTFSLELPPYRPPNILRTLYTSLIDRTLFVLWRAIVFAVPAGAAIWLVSTVQWGGQPVAVWMIHGLDPFAVVLGLNGIILLAYIVAIPANEIVMPAVLMLTVLTLGLSGLGEQGAGVMFEVEGQQLTTILGEGGWTLKTAVCLMIFSLCHNPCSTTLYTIYKETGSMRWTVLSALLPLVVGIILCSLISALWGLFI